MVWGGRGGQENLNGGKEIINRVAVKVMKSYMAKRAGVSHN